MAQDFAKQRQGNTRQKRKTASATREEAASPNVWGWYFGGFFTGILAVGIGWLGVIRLDEIRSTPDTQPAGINESETPVIAFDFYSALENPDAAQASQTAPETAEAQAEQGVVEPAPIEETVARVSGDNQVYLVQAGSFFDRQDAESLRARLILLNLSASIAQGVVSGRTVYRVQAGPYNGRRAAEDVQRTLTANGIESIFLRPR
jgi:cell division protein FtsN